MIKIITRDDDKPALNVISRLELAMQPDQLDPVVARVAAETHRHIVELTPKKFFGQVRKAWQINKPAPGAREVFNDNKVMRMLEEGTVAHGPVTAKALFIPLTARAALAHAANYGFESTKRGLKVRTHRLVKGEIVRTSRNLIYGKDYVLARWVRGIRPHFIVAAERLLAETRLHEAAKVYLRQVVKG